jgi:hypothetical protein
MKTLLHIALIIGGIILSGYAHESDLIRHCIEEGTMHTWNNDYTFECKAIKKGDSND